MYIATATILSSLTSPLCLQQILKEQGQSYEVSLHQPHAPR